MRLNFFDHSWRYADSCPCDLHFAEYLEERGIRGRTIFHFGTGEHHLLALRNAARAPEDRNEILAVTASLKEHAEYARLIIEDAELAISYKVLFTDIHTLSPRLLPAFDLVTLFHHGEYYDPEESAYAPLDDRGLIEIFLTRLAPGGRLLFYTGSIGFHRTAPLLADLVGGGRLAKVDEHRSLVVYARPGD